jgi:lysophospholipase L1-like esterase
MTSASARPPRTSRHLLRSKHQRQRRADHRRVPADYCPGACEGPEGAWRRADSFQGSFYWDAAAEAKRTAIKAWIKESGEFDGVVDFASAVADPADPLKFRADLHSGDFLHPNDAGYQAMANAIKLSLLRSEED